MIKEDEPNWGAHEFSPEALDLLRGVRLLAPLAAARSTLTAVAATQGPRQPPRMWY